MLKSLIVSHTPTATTGYGRVVRRLAHSLLKTGHRVAVMGAGYTGGPHELPYPLIPWHSSSAEEIRRCFGVGRPNVLLTIGDPWMFEQLPARLERGKCTWVAYFPVDGYPLPEEWKRWVRSVDVPVVFSRFTQELVTEATGKTPPLIYHGVDTKAFAPMDREAAKARANVAGRFVVGTVARNQQRKNLPALVKAFARFSADKPDAILYLHTQVIGDYNMLELVRRFGVEDKTRVTEGLGTDRGIPDAMLATVYNAMDVFVLPTMAEGFGLPIIEAQACGTPALVTDFSACPELVPDPIQRLRVKETLVMRRNFEQAIVDVDDIVEKLNHFYHHRDELRELGTRCHAFVQQFDWSVACSQFVDLLASVTGVTAGRPSAMPAPSTQLPTPAVFAADQIPKAADGIGSGLGLPGNAGPVFLGRAMAKRGRGTPKFG